MKSVKAMYPTASGVPQNLHHDGGQVFVKVQAEDQRTDHACVVGATPQSQNGLDERASSAAGTAGC